VPRSWRYQGQPNRTQPVHPHLSRRTSPHPQASHVLPHLRTTTHRYRSARGRPRPAPQLRRRRPRQPQAGPSILQSAEGWSQPGMRLVMVPPERTMQGLDYKHAIQASLYMSRPCGTWYANTHTMGRASRAQVAARWAYYGGRCWMCGAQADTMDHVKPIAKGGSNHPSNLRPACNGCNGRKS
jgi:5-methylcytosine-specific restriction endonuclease McrA